MGAIKVGANGPARWLSQSVLSHEHLRRIGVGGDGALAVRYVLAILAMLAWVKMRLSETGPSEAGSVNRERIRRVSEAGAMRSMMMYRGARGST